MNKRVCIQCEKEYSYNPGDKNNYWQDLYCSYDCHDKAHTTIEDLLGEEE